MQNFDIKIMDELDIHSISICAFRMGGKPAPSLMVSVEQGMLDANNCRSSIKHIFHAETLLDAGNQAIARAKAIKDILCRK